MIPRRGDYPSPSVHPKEGWNSRFCQHEVALSTWPHPGGTIRPLAPIPGSLFRVQEHASCPRCGESDLNNFRFNGQFTSRRTLETRDCALCKKCGRAFYLELGLHVPRKARISRAQREAREGTFIVANDARPRCPFCNGSRIWRRGRLRWSQRWQCCNCQRRFVARGKFRRATLDRRKCSRLV
jgi:hypothetical protein